MPRWKDMAKVRRVKKTVPGKKVSAKPAASSGQGEDTPELAGLSRRHRLHLHNITRRPANWLVTGGGGRVRGVLPPESRTTLRVDHAARGYRIAFWRTVKGKAGPKTAARVGPAGAAIYTGRKVFVTHPH